MNKLRIISFVLLLLIILTVNLQAMDSFEEDAWLGAYFLSPEREFRMEPFIEIRNNNYSNRTPESDMKTIIADYIIAENLTDYDRLDLDDFDIDDREYKDIDEIEKEINLLYKITKEVEARYRSLKNNLNASSFYRFFHIQVSEFEEVTLDHLDYVLVEENSNYDEKIDPGENELQGSKKTVEMINNLLPVQIEQMKAYRNLPLVTYYQFDYSDSQKERMRDKVKDAVFVDQEVVDIQEISFSIEDLEETYEYYSWYDESAYDYIFSNTEIEKLDESITEILDDF